MQGNAYFSFDKRKLNWNRARSQTRPVAKHRDLFEIDKSAAAAVCRCLSQPINYVIAPTPYFIQEVVLNLNAPKHMI